MRLLQPLLPVSDHDSPHLTIQKGPAQELASIFVLENATERLQGVLEEARMRHYRNVLLGPAAYKHLHVQLPNAASQHHGTKTNRLCSERQLCRALRTPAVPGSTWEYPSENDNL